MRFAVSTALFLALLLACGPPGCADTTEGKSYQANKLLTFGNEQWQKAVDGQLLDDRTAYAVGAALEAASAALDKYDAAWKAGADPTTLETYLAQFEAAMSVVEQHLPTVAAYHKRE